MVEGMVQQSGPAELVHLTPFASFQPRQTHVQHQNRTLERSKGDRSYPTDVHEKNAPTIGSLSGTFCAHAALVLHLSGAALLAAPRRKV